MDFHQHFSRKEIAKRIKEGMPKTIAMALGAGVLTAIILMNQEKSDIDK